MQIALLAASRAHFHANQGHIKRSDIEIGRVEEGENKKTRNNQVLPFEDPLRQYTGSCHPEGRKRGASRHCLLAIAGHPPVKSAGGSISLHIGRQCC